MPSGTSTIQRVNLEIADGLQNDLTEEFIKNNQYME